MFVGEQFQSEQSDYEQFGNEQLPASEHAAGMYQEYGIRMLWIAGLGNLKDRK